ncbi:MAG: hypothetical protein ABJG78_20200 [Cyclobacteriaceae bacterium]
MRNKNLIWIGLSISILLYVLTIAFELDLFEKIEQFVRPLERFEVDELIIPVIIFSVFCLLQGFSHVRKARIESEKAKIYTAMLSSTYHILNNLLNQLQLFQMTAKNTAGFDAEVLSKFDEAIDDALGQLEKLSHVSAIDEAAIKASVGTKKY